MMKRKTLQILVFAVLGALLYGCLIDSSSGEKQGCRANLSISCSDTTQWQTGTGSGMLIRNWDADKRIFWEQYYNKDGFLDAEQGGRRELDAQGRDSVISRYYRLNPDTSLSRRILITYASNGLKSEEKHFDSQNHLILHLQWNSGKKDTLSECYVRAKKACEITGIYVTSFGDTLDELFQWNPEDRSLWVLRFNPDSLVDWNLSFKHLYTDFFKDSLLLWPERINDGDTAYKGWGLYHYDLNHKLQKIEMFNSWEPDSAYGYILYDGKSQVKEKMEDGLTTVFDSKGRSVKEYSQEFPDTLVFTYDEVGRIKLEQNFHRTVLTRQIERQYWEASQILKIKLDSDTIEINTEWFGRDEKIDSSLQTNLNGIALRRIYNDSQSRDTLVINYAQGQIVKTSRYLYQGELWQAEQRIERDSNDKLIRTIWMNGSAQWIKIRYGEGEIQDCQKPLDYFSCNVNIPDGTQGL